MLLLPRQGGFMLVHGWELIYACAAWLGVFLLLYEGTANLFPWCTVCSGWLESISPKGMSGFGIDGLTGWLLGYLGVHTSGLVGIILRLFEHGAEN